ncbi:hypothetical protein PtB15_6B685 [Puccinia triticina]|nr:hypothetical protein PtB15_6B685 [Puccinia triticina]
MITSNHKKLVNACYPVAVKNKTLAAIAPDPNALSKLIYYCATRPHKIHKITSYLISYAQSQALPSSFTASLSVYRHSKPGLICTIKIFTHLIHNPRINPAILAPHLATIIAIGLGLFNQAFSSEPLPPTTTTTHHPETPEKASEASGYFGSDWVAHDLDITRTTIELFSTYAEAIRPDCLQDDQQARNHLFFLAKFASVAIQTPPITHPPSPDPPKPARCLALIALASSLTAPGLYSTPSFDRQIRMIIPGLVSSILPSPQRPPDELITLIHQACPSCPPAPPDDGELLAQLSALQAAITPLSPPAVSPATELHLVLLSTTALHFLLSTQLSTLAHFEICLTEILIQLEASIATPPSSDYYGWLGPALLRWTTPKYRASVIELVVDRLTLLDSKQPHKPKSKQQHLQRMTVLAGMLAAMLSDPLTGTIQLLNTLTLIHQLLRLLHSTLVLDPSGPTAAQALLSGLLVDGVGGLARREFYDAQINDMCKHVLAQISALLGPSVEADPSEKDGPAVAAQPLFECLERILTNANTTALPSPDRRQARLPVSLLLMKDALPLLERLSHPPSRAAFFKALHVYLRFEAFRAPPLGRQEPDGQLAAFLHAFCALLGSEAARPSSSVAAPGPGWLACLLEILAHREFVVLATCLPLLRELDAISDRRSPDEPGEQKAFVLECLATVGKVWELGAVPVARTLPRRIQWDVLAGQLAQSPLVQLKAGTDRAGLEAQFLPHRWTVLEARTLAGWTASGGSRRGSLSGGRVRPRVTSAAASTSEWASSCGAGRAGVRQERGKSLLSALHDRSSPTGSLSTVHPAPSVSDLRNSLLGAGFFHLPSPRTAKGASISGRSSVLLPDDIGPDDPPYNVSSADLARYLSATTGPSSRSFITKSAAPRGGDDFGRPAASVDSAAEHRHPKSLQLDLLKARAVSLARRQTLTAEVLDKVRRNSRIRPLPPPGPPPPMPMPASAAADDALQRQKEKETQAGRDPDTSAGSQPPTSSDNARAPSPHAHIIATTNPPPSPPAGLPSKSAALAPPATE